MVYQIPERAGSINGVEGRFFAISANGADGETFINQTWKSEARPVKGYGAGALIRAEVRYDDSCRNGHNSFAITGTVTTAARESRGLDVMACGCIHDDIAKAFPELAPLIKWHLTSSDGPMHGVANAVYHAGDRDHNGLRAGESRQIINGRTKEPCWHLVAVNPDGETVAIHAITKTADGAKPTAAPRLEWQPWCRIGEGKARDFAAARSSAVWPEATDEELSAEPAELRATLEARMPRLLEQFRCDIEAAGLQWSPATIAPALKA